MQSLTVEDRTATGRRTGSIALPDLPERITLRELIRLRVREEVARYNVKPVETFRGLVQPDGSTRSGEGFLLPMPRRIDWERQADIAIEQFGAQRLLRHGPGQAGRLTECTQMEYICTHD